MGVKNLPFEVGIAVQAVFVEAEQASGALVVDAAGPDGALDVGAQLAEEHLAASDRGVILLRKTILRAMETAQKGGLPQGVRAMEQAEEIFKIQSFTGIRPKGVF